MADFLQTVQGELIPVIASSIRKVYLRPSTPPLSGSVLVIEHTVGKPTEYPYADNASGLVAFNNIAASLGAQHLGDPAITLINPAALNDSGFPVTVAITGIAFDATAQILLQNYSATLTPATTFVNSTGLTISVAAGGVGTYDVVYSDNNGKVFRAANGLVIY